MGVGAAQDGARRDGPETAATGGPWRSRMRRGGVTMTTSKRAPSVGAEVAQGDTGGIAAFPPGARRPGRSGTGSGGNHLQGFHRLFWGEYSGSGCYIVVTAGREGS